jgi:hypothetical protein
LDLAPLALDHAYCVTARVGLQEVPAGIALGGDAVWTFGASGPRSFEVRRWQIDRPGRALVQPVAVLSFTAQRSEDLYPSEYLAVHQGSVAVGYNTTDFGNPQGSVLWGREGTTPEEVPAAGNYDAVLVDEETLLVDGLGAGTLEGQAVYAIRKDKEPLKLIADLGEASAALALGARVLFAGGYTYGEGKSKLFGIPRVEVSAALAAGEELSATKSGVLIAEGCFLGAAALDDDLVILSCDEKFEYDGVWRIPVSIGAGAMATQPRKPVVFPTAGRGGAVKRIAADGPRLGLVFVDGTGDVHLAIIRERAVTE